MAVILQSNDISPLYVGNLKQKILPINLIINTLNLYHQHSGFESSSDLPCSCVGFLQAPHFPPTVQNHYKHISWIGDHPFSVHAAYSSGCGVYPSTLDRSSVHLTHTHTRARIHTHKHTRAHIHCSLTPGRNSEPRINIMCFCTVGGNRRNPPHTHTHKEHANIAEMGLEKKIQPCTH